MVSPQNGRRNVRIAAVAMVALNAEPATNSTQSTAAPPASTAPRLTTGSGKSHATSKGS